MRMRSESALFFQAFLSKDVESLLFSFKSNKQNGNVLVFLLFRSRLTHNLAVILSGS